MRLFRYLLAAGGGALGATYVLTGGGTSIPREVWQWVKYLPEPAAVSSWEPATPRQEEAAAAESGPNSQAKSRAPQQNLKAESSDDRSPAMHASSIPLVQRHQSGGAEGSAGARANALQADPEGMSTVELLMTAAQAQQPAIYPAIQQSEGNLRRVDRGPLLAQVSAASSSASTPGASSVTIGSRTTNGWVVVGLSVEGRPIYLKALGQGAFTSLIVAGLDGEDRIAVHWLDHFVRELQAQPEQYPDERLLILRAANPDGLTARHLENAHGVALNRNFPTAHYKPAGKPRAGDGPASEPETRCLLHVLFQYRPQRLIHVRSATDSVVGYNGVAALKAQALAEATQLPLEAFNPETEPGSLEDFATSVLGIEVLSLQLRSGDDWRAAGVAHLPTILQAARQSALTPPVEHASERYQRQDHPVPFITTPAQTTRSEVVSPFRVEESPSPLPTVGQRTTTNKPITNVPARRGYEELPPPPHKRPVTKTRP